MSRSDFIILFLLLIDSGLTHSKLFKRFNGITNRNAAAEESLTKKSSCGNDLTKAGSFVNMNSEQRLLINLRKIAF